MNRNRLSAFLSSPESHRKLLGNYPGGNYAIGITKTAERPKRLAILVRVNGKGYTIPAEIEVDDEMIPVIVESDQNF